MFIKAPCCRAVKESPCLENLPFQAICQRSGLDRSVAAPPAPADLLQMMRDEFHFLWSELLAATKPVGKAWRS
jgi:hypothetical protein